MKSFGFILMLMILLGSRAGASEIFSSADVPEAGSWNISVYGSRAKTEPIIEIDGTNAIQVPTSGGTSTVFSHANTDVEMEQTASQSVALIEVRPHEGLVYKVKVGQVRDFELEFSSGSQVNSLKATEEGYLWGVGVGALIAPASIVSTAVRWDLMFTQTVVDLDRFEDPSAVTAVNNRVKQEEAQGSVQIGRRFGPVEPYAGLKLMWVKTELLDRATKQNVSGTTEAFSPFIGLQWSFFNKESLVVEGSFVDEKAIAVGFKANF